MAEENNERKPKLCQKVFSQKLRVKTNSDDDKAEIMYVKNDDDEDTVRVTKPDFRDSELYKSIMKGKHDKGSFKIILNGIKGFPCSSKNIRDSVKEDNKHDYTDKYIEDENPDKFKVEFKPKYRQTVKDAMPYTIDESERLCRECDEQFLSNASLMMHYRIHFGQYICGVCNNRYMTAGSLSKHKASHKTGPFLCSECGQEFSNINSLHNHKKVKHRRQPFRCRHCIERFPTYNKKLTHEVYVHKEQMKYQCPYCDKRFIYAVAKINHVNNVHKITIVECKLCGANFKKNYIKKHMFKKHNIGQGWQCSLCPATRPNKADLKRHMHIHVNTPRYVCKLCNKGFSTRCAVKYHIEKHITRLEYNGDPDDITDCKYQVEDLDVGEVTRYEDKSFDREDITEVAVHYNLQNDDFLIEEVVEGETIVKSEKEDIKLEFTG